MPERQEGKNRKVEERSGFLLELSHGHRVDSDVSREGGGGGEEGAADQHGGDGVGVGDGGGERESNVLLATALEADNDDVGKE